MPITPPPPDTPPAGDPVTALRAVRESVEMPLAADPTRAGVGDHGLPSDRGLRPHLYVTVTADRLHTATGSTPDRQSPSGNGAGPDASPPGPLPGYGPVPDARIAQQAHQPAILHGYGPITDTLLGTLGCDADTTTISIDGSGPGAGVLDVGRTARLATMMQHQAVITAQDGACFNPGCDRTHLEIHRMVPWSLGGPTDLAKATSH